MHSSSRSPSSSSLKRIEKDDNERFAILYVGICFKIFVVVSAAFVVAVFEGAITDVVDDDDDNDDDDVVVVVVVVVFVGTTAALPQFLCLAIFRSKFRRRFAVFQEFLRSITSWRKRPSHAC